MPMEETQHKTSPRLMRTVITSLTDNCIYTYIHIYKRFAVTLEHNQCGKVAVRASCHGPHGVDRSGRAHWLACEGPYGVKRRGHSPPDLTEPQQGVHRRQEAYDALGTRCTRVWLAAEASPRS